MGQKLFPVQEERSEFPCRRGYNLHVLIICSKAPQLRGVLVYHHGFGEHCDRHLRILHQLADRLRLLIVTYDAHGHGRSGPNRLALRAYVHTWRHLVDDLVDVVEQVALPTARELGIPENKLFAAGHSMGGLAVSLAALQRPELFQGIMLSSPLISVTVKNSYGEWAQIAALRLLNLLIPRRPFLKRRSVEVGIRDPQAVKEILADPLWYRGPIKVRTVVSCINGTLEIQARLHEVTVPVYVQQGTLDKTCSVAALRQLLPRFGSRDVTYHEVQGGLHDLMLDLETPDCHRRMVAWLQAQLA